MGSIRRAAVVVALVAVALPAAQAASAATVGQVQTISGPSPFASCQDSLAGNVLNAEVEPWLAVSPTDGAIAAAWQQDRWGNPNQGGAHGLVAWSSATNSRSFAPFTTCSGGTAATNGNYDRASDVWLSYGPDGVLYQVALQFDWFTADDAVTVSRSTDDGATWSTPSVVFRTKRSSFTHGEDKESITADPYHPGVVYVVWDRYSNQNSIYTDGHGQNANKGPAFFSKSTDGGRTWSDPAAIYAKGNGTIGNQIVVLPNGTLVDFFTNFVATNVKGGVSFSEELDAIRSSDGGKTWSSPILVSPTTPNGTFDPATGRYIRAGDILFDVAVDPSNGTLYAVWEDARFADGVDQVAFTKSTDGGLSWPDAPVKVSRSDGATPAYRQAFTPSVDVAPDHTVAITYYDFRLSPAGGDAVDYWGSTSSDGGASWSPDARLTTSSFPASTAPDAGGPMIGDYEGLGHSGTTFESAFEVTTTDPANSTDIELASFH
jgi:hypothetical protein